MRHYSPLLEEVANLRFISGLTGVQTLSQQISTTPEAALLLACINVSSSREDKSAAVDRLIRQPFDWNRFVQMVAAHGLASIVCPILKPKTGGNGVPSEAFAKLRYLDLAIAEKAARNARELVGLMTGFGAAGIPALVFKGPALSVVAYGNPLIRDYSDLDILVHRSDVQLAAEVLMSNGFAVTTYNRKVFESGFFHNKSENFYSNQASVDLHWTLQDRWLPFGPDERALWSRTENFVLNGREIQTLNAVDHLLFLCVHACKHGWPNLASVVDIARLVTTYPRQVLQTAIHAATHLRFRRSVLLSMALIHNLTGALTSEEVLTAVIEDASVARLEKQIASRLVRESPFLSTFSRWTSAIHTADHVRDKFAVITKQLFMPIVDDHTRLSLPRRFYLLYYVMRPLRLTGKVAVIMAHHCHRFLRTYLVKGR
jgi:hypothetical protein